MNTDPYPGKADLMAELGKLADLHAEADRAHAEAAAEARNRRPASPVDTVEDENVER